MTIVKDGSKWSGGDKKFVVIQTIEQEGHTWVHYREDKASEPKEYSCYLESFITRFNALPE
jgi:hypothetical protein